jgi:hypothetical protein
MDPRIWLVGATLPSLSGKHDEEAQDCKKIQQARPTLQYQKSMLLPGTSMALITG